MAEHKRGIEHACIKTSTFTRNLVLNKNALLLTALALVILLNGCATTSVQKIEQLDFGDTPPKILLMPLDVELSLLTAGGMLEPKAEWTDRARKHLVAAFENEARIRKADLVLYDAGSFDSESIQLQLEKLHEAVGSTVLFHHYMQPLPTKKKTFDWTLGAGAKQLQEAYDAQYAMFVFIRDSYSSGGRVALQIFAALAGVGVAGSSQVGFASLVDLSNGDIVWFNRLAKAGGELRNAEAASAAVKSLLSTLPGS